MPTRLLHSTHLNTDLESHFLNLGVSSVATYKLWCYRHGFSTSLEKTPAQLQNEIDQLKSQTPKPDPTINKHHDPNRVEYLKRIFRGELQNEKLSTVPHAIREMYNTFSNDPDAQQAFGRLILHIEKYSDLLWHQKVIGQYGNIQTNTFLAGLRQLTRHHKVWLRPIEDWRPKNRKPNDQFHTLARHLLAKYDVSPVFDCAFFQGDTQEAYTQQGWFLHIAGGQNIRTAGVPMRITKRMAHQVMQYRHGRHTIYQALRGIQFEAFGGHRKSSGALMDTPLGERLENEDFWETVVQFLANQRFLDRSYIGPIIDYIRNQKYTPQRIPQPDGTETEGPPPHPNFCMKGRSANKLIRQVDVWHQELTGMEDVDLQTWEPSGFNEFEHTAFNTELKRNIQWTVHELITSQQLYAEGRIMSHCAGSYTRRCASGEKSIWSIRALDLDAAEENQIQEHVLTIEVDNKKRAVIQDRGKYNLQAFGKKHMARERNTNNVYLLLLRYAPTIMRMWMDRSGLSHG